MFHPRLRLLTRRRVVAVFGTCLAVYMFLYTNALREVRSSSLYTNVRASRLYHMFEEDLQAVLWESSKPVHLLRPRISSQSNNGENFVDEYAARIAQNQTIPILTLFTSWTDKAEKYLVHNITSVNWLSFRPYVIPVMFTNDVSVARECTKLGWKVFPIRVAAANGVPVLKHMFIDVTKAFNSTFYGYANSDILFTHQLIETLISITNTTGLKMPMILSGRRTNVENVKRDEGCNLSNISRIAAERGTLFGGNAEDYFITQRTYPWSYIPDVVIGRRAYDNWLIYNARKSKYSVIDISDTCLAVHQTTASGNHEGHGAKNTHYNYNLLKKIYRKINYAAGALGCVANHTQYDNNGVIKLQSRYVGRHCHV